MRAEERQHRILALARSDGGVDVAKLAADLAVAPETVRRDLRLLEQHGLIRRTHGIDEGFTPQLIAEALPTDRPLTVVTASLPTAAVLAAAPSCTVLMLGGRVRGRTLATVDHWATRMLAGFVLDLAFVGANGISREHGLTTPDPAVADVKAQVVQVARRLVFAGVHTKFGASSFCRFAEVADLETIITDTALPATEAHRYSLLGPHVLRV
ncbi:MAG: transcriptional regulator [Actinobacteria bacterium 13_2_20CM_2_72_6]|nr:MAG: transcriptional regulator [Actinobacteria bacterium 13_2_20CM_2_72_6]